MSNEYNVLVVRAVVVRTLGKKLLSIWVSTVMYSSTFINEITVEATGHFGFHNILHLLFPFDADREDRADG